jgi:hypothetical protein
MTAKPSGLTVTVDGQPVPLDDCGWIERRPCGCIVSAAVAVVTGNGGRTLATEDQAAKHLRPTKRDRTGAEREGLRLELITMRHYREHIGAKWECDTHTTSTAEAKR